MQRPQEIGQKNVALVLTSNSDIYNGSDENTGSLPWVLCNALCNIPPVNKPSTEQKKLKCCLLLVVEICDRALICPPPPCFLQDS